jgi:hypothetical protein
MQAETFQQFRPNCALSPIHRALLDARSAALRVTRICKRADEESPASTADSVAMASVRKEWRAQLAAELRELYDETSAETVLTTPPAPAMAKVYPTPGRPAVCWHARRKRCIMHCAFSRRPSRVLELAGRRLPLRRSSRT